MAYNILINDYQRRMLVDAMDQVLTLLHHKSAEAREAQMAEVVKDALPGVQAFATHMEEFCSLRDCLKDLPKVEAESPGVTHGLCL